MKYLLLKMRRDLANMWTQFLSVFLMAFLGLFIYVGVEGAWYGLQNEYQKYFNDTRLASAWIYANNISERDLHEISKLSTVSDAERGMFLSAKIDSLNERTEAKIRLASYTDRSISKFHLVSGAEYDANKAGIWLDSRFATANDLVVGDFLVLKIDTIEKSIQVRGLVLNAEYIFYTGSNASLTPNHKLYGYAFFNDSAMKDMPLQYNEMRVLLEGNDTSSVVLRNEIQRILGDRYMGFADRTSYEPVSFILTRISQIKRLSFLFSFVFILLSILTMQTTMTRLVDTQRIQIGTFKALGFSNLQIHAHYAMYGLIVGLLGSIGGFLLAPHIISPILLKSMMVNMALPDYPAKISIISYLMVALVTVCCTTATIFACRKGLSGMPATTMRGFAPKAGAHLFVERFKKLWRHLPFEWKWCARDIARNKARSAMGTIGVIGCLVLMIASLGIQDSLDEAYKDVYERMYSYRTKIVLAADATAEDCDELEKAVGQKGQWVQEASIEYEGIANIIGLLTIMDGGNYIALKNTNNESVVVHGSGAYVTQKIANSLGISRGETIRFRLIDDTEYTSTFIKDIINVPSPQGIYVSKKEWSIQGHKMEPTAMLCTMNVVDDDVNNLPYVDEVSTLTSQYESMVKNNASFEVVFYLLQIAAVLLGVVILYNLGALSFTERTREYATMKVLGFFQSEIGSFAIRENLTATIVGWLIGIPISLKFLEVYVDAVSYDKFVLSPHITMITFGLASIVTIGCSLGVSYVFGHMVKKINMIEALKSVE